MSGVPSNPLGYSYPAKPKDVKRAKLTVEGDTRIITIPPRNAIVQIITYSIATWFVLSALLLVALTFLWRPPQWDAAAFTLLGVFAPIVLIGSYQTLSSFVRAVRYSPQPITITICPRALTLEDASTLGAQPRLIRREDLRRASVTTELTPTLAQLVTISIVGSGGAADVQFSTRDKNLVALLRRELTL